VFVFNEWCAVDYDLTDARSWPWPRSATSRAARRGPFWRHRRPATACGGWKMRCKPLFDRQPRGLEPTRAGEALLRHARQVFASIEQMHAELSPMPAASAAR
jgi:hypothetical protein